MNHLSIQHAMCAGMSQGGDAALRLALAHPQLVRGLTVLSTQALPEDHGVIPGHKKMLAIWTQGGLPERMADNIACIMLAARAPQAQSWKVKWHQ